MGLFDSFLDRGRSLSDRNRYVNDFEIVETTDAKGRPRKAAVYKGVWTVLRSADARTRARMGAAVAAALGAAAAYVRMVLLTHAGSGQLLVMLPLLAGLFPVLYLLMGVLALPFRGRPMRSDQYMHSFIRASRSAVAIMVFLLVSLAAALIGRIIAGDWLFLPGDRQFFLMGLLSLFLAGGVVGLLRGIELTERENGAFRQKPLK